MEIYWILGGAALMVGAHFFPQTPVFSRAALLMAWYLIYMIIRWAMGIVESEGNMSREQYALAGAIVGFVTALLGWMQSVYRDYRVESKQIEVKK